MQLFMNAPTHRSHAKSHYTQRKKRDNKICRIWVRDGIHVKKYPLPCSTRKSWMWMKKEFEFPSDKHVRRLICWVRDWVTHGNSFRDACFEFIRSIIAPEMKNGTRFRVTRKKKQKAKRARIASYAILSFCPDFNFIQSYDLSLFRCTIDAFRWNGHARSTHTHNWNSKHPLIVSAVVCCAFRSRLGRRRGRRDNCVLCTTFSSQLNYKQTYQTETLLRRLLFAHQQRTNVRMHSIF